jgi:hypothetical protein
MNVPKRPRLIGWTAGAALVLSAGVAPAQTTPAPAAAPSPGAATTPLAPLYACADMPDPSARLACYDAAVARVRGQESRAEIVTFDKERIETVRREAFGFRLPSLPRLRVPGFGGGGAAAAGAASGGAGAAPAAPALADVEDIEEQTLRVARVGRSGDRVTLHMENGQVWRFVEAGEIQGSARPPFNVNIKSASLGSYILSIEGRNRGYRVRRVE